MIPIANQLLRFVIISLLSRNTKEKNDYTNFYPAELAAHIFLTTCKPEIKKYFCYL